jgi:ParB family chromosome partitioning protein
VEEIVRQAKEGSQQAEAKRAKTADRKQDAVYHQLKKHLTQFFQTPVQLTCSEKGSGKISIKFKDEKELERIIAIFDKLNQH